MQWGHCPSSQCRSSGTEHPPLIQHPLCRRLRQWRVGWGGQSAVDQMDSPFWSTLQQEKGPVHPPLLSLNFVLLIGSWLSLSPILPSPWHAATVGGEACHTLHRPDHVPGLGCSLWATAWDNAPGAFTTLLLLNGTEKGIGSKGGYPVTSYQSSAGWGQETGRGAEASLAVDWAPAGGSSSSPPPLNVPCAPPTPGPKNLGVRH